MGETMTMKISEELRKWCDDLDSTDIFCTTETPYTLADRIDNETAELPRGSDGKPIHVGDTVYGKDGKAWCVRGVTIGEMSEALRYAIGVTNDTDGWRHIRSEWLTHERPDSLERIADELDEMVDAAQSADDGCEKLADLADRIRRLAKEEAE